MFIISIVILVIFSLSIFYLFNRFVLELKTNFLFLLPPAVLFIAGVYIRIPIIYFIQYKLGSFIQDDLVFKKYPLWIAITLLLMAPVIEEFLKGIWIIPFGKLRKKLFNSPVSVLEFGAVSGIGFGTMEAIWLAIRVKNLLYSFHSFYWLGFIGERIGVILGHSMLTTILLYNVYLFYSKKGNIKSGWSIGYLITILMHTFINSALIWYYLRDSGWYMLTLGRVQLFIAITALFLYWGHIYNFIVRKEKERLH
jgi:hypothetical protein